MVSQVVRQTFLPRIRQTFPSGSVRELESASPRSQQEQPLPPAWLCQWPSHPSAASPAWPSWSPEKAPLGWQKGHRDYPSTLLLHIRHTYSQHWAKHLCCPIPTHAGGTGRGIPMPVALLQGVSAVSGLQIQFFHPVPPPQQVSYAAYQPLPKGILKLLNSQVSLRPQGGPSKSHDFRAGM